MSKHPVAYQIGRLFGKSPWLFVAVPVGLAFALLWPTSDDAETAPKATATASTPRPVDAKTKCQTDRESIVANYQTAMAEGSHWKAFAAVNSCAQLLKDGELATMAQAAELEGRLVKARDTTRTPADRLIAIELIERTDKAKAQEFAAIKARLQKTVAQQEAKARKAVAALKRSQGVTIGMSEQDVLDSSWGRPTKKNLTISAHGTREQWVYDGHQYLYFTNGRLTGIQTNE